MQYQHRRRPDPPSKHRTSVLPVPRALASGAAVSPGMAEEGDGRSGVGWKRRMRVNPVEGNREREEEEETSLAEERVDQRRPLPLSSLHSSWVRRRLALRSSSGIAEQHGQERKPRRSGMEEAAFQARQSDAVCVNMCVRLGIRRGARATLDLTRSPAGYRPGTGTPLHRDEVSSKQQRNRSRSSNYPVLESYDNAESCNPSTSLRCKHPRGQAAVTARYTGRTVVCLCCLPASWTI